MITELLADLDAESRELDDLVAGAPDWSVPTPAEGWTVGHQIGHLMWTDRAAILAITDPEAFRPYRTGVAFLKACHDQDPGRFAWRAKAYEFVEKIPAIDLLAGSAALREGLDAGASLDELTARWPRDEGAFAEQRAEFLLYE